MIAIGAASRSGYGVKRKHSDGSTAPRKPCGAARINVGTNAIANDQPLGQNPLEHRASSTSLMIPGRIARGGYRRQLQSVQH
jgi:hypothetical protein